MVVGLSVEIVAVLVAFDIFMDIKINILSNDLIGNMI